MDMAYAPDRFKESIFNRQAFFPGKAMDLMPMYSGSHKCPPGHRYGPHVRDHHYFHFILKGSGVLTAYQKQFTLKEGDGFMAFPGEAITYEASQSDPWEYTWIAFSGELAGEIVSRAGFFESTPIFRCTHKEISQRIKMAMSNLLACSDAGYTAYLTGVAWLYQLFAAFDEGAKRQTASANHVQSIARAKAYINGNMAQKITVSDVAAHVGVCTHYLTKIFKLYFGLTTIEYIAECKVSRAESLLTYTQLPVGSVAHQIGFADPLYFSSWFKKATGMSPKEYRAYSTKPLDIDETKLRI